jgi:hypothetical protein
MHAGLEVHGIDRIQLGEEHRLGAAYPLLVRHIDRLGMAAEGLDLLGEALKHAHIDCHISTPRRA